MNICFCQPSGAPCQLEIKSQIHRALPAYCNEVVNEMQRLRHSGCVQFTLGAISRSRGHGRIFASYSLSTTRKIRPCSCRNTLVDEIIFDIFVLTCTSRQQKCQDLQTIYDIVSKAKKMQSILASAAQTRYSACIKREHKRIVS